jgi:hypothetical protein
MLSRPADIARPLGAAEEMFWLFDQGSPFHFVLIAELHGDISINQWRNALDAIQRRHPLLTVCIDSPWNRVPHFRYVPDHTIPLRVVEGSLLWQRETERELITPFDSAEAPLLRAVLMKKENRSAILLVAHHSISDGMSASFLMRDLFESLAGKALDPLKLIQHEDLLYSIPVRTSQEPGIGTDYSLANEVVKHPIYVKSHAFSAELTRQLHEAARREKTTLHGLICAGLAFAGPETNPEWRENPLRIFSPVSIRKAVGLGEDCILAIAASLYEAELETTQTIWELARGIRERLLPTKTIDGIRDAMQKVDNFVRAGMSVPEAVAFHEVAFPTDVSVSNIGPAAFVPDFGTFQVHSFWGPAVARIGLHEQTIGISSINGSLHFVQTGRTPVPELLTSLEGKLLEMCCSAV